MASTLRLVRPGSGKEPISVPEFLERLGSREFDRIEARVRSMRETFNAPDTVANHAEYHHQLFRFYAHYLNTFYRSSFDANQVESLAWDHLRRLHKDLPAVERDAILNRSGGFIGVINEITDALVKEQIEGYIDLVFFDYIPRDQEVRLRLAQELMDQYISVLFPNDPELKHPFMFAANIEQVLKEFALRLHEMGRRSWRW
jgi:hypothetical protein